MNGRWIVFAIITYYLIGLVMVVYGKYASGVLFFTIFPASALSLLEDKKQSRRKSKPKEKKS